MISPAAHAAAAAEEIRHLNRRSLHGYTDPADVDDVLGPLEALAHRLPQAIEQAARWLDAERTAGRIRHDMDGDVTTAVYRACIALGQATADAERLAVSLEVARRETSHLGGLLEAEVGAEVQDGD